MVEAKVIIMDEAGIHARPAALLVKFLKDFPDSHVTFINGGKKSGANIIQLLGLGVVKNTELTIQVSGGNEEDVLEKIISFIRNME